MDPTVVLQQALEQWNVPHQILWKEQGILGIGYDKRESKLLTWSVQDKPLSKYVIEKKEKFESHPFVINYYFSKQFLEFCITNNFTKVTNFFFHFIKHFSNHIYLNF